MSNLIDFADEFDLTPPKGFDSWKALGDALCRRDEAASEWLYEWSEETLSPNVIPYANGGDRGCMNFQSTSLSVGVDYGTAETNGELQVTGTFTVDGECLDRDENDPFDHEVAGTFRFDITASGVLGVSWDFDADDLVEPD